MKPFLLLQHRYLDEASDNEYESVLKYSQLNPDSLVRIRMEKESIADLNPKDYSGIITGGGPANVSDPEENKPMEQLRFEQEMNILYDQIFEKDIPYLGMCYGMGSLTNYLNGTVSKEKYSEPVGPVTIQLKTENEPILERIPSSFRALVGHKESCLELPKGVKLLASSATCPIQMIKCKQNIFATQFHPELDVPSIILRIRVYKNHGYFDPRECQELIDAVEDEEILFPQLILQNFISLYSEMN